MMTRHFASPNQHASPAEEYPPGGSAARSPPADSPYGEPFQTTLELLPFALFLSDHHGRIVLANAAATKLFGYAREELIGAPADMLIPALQTNLHAAPFSDIALARPEAATRNPRDGFARRKDGTEFPADITTKAISSHPGGADALTLVVDRTDQHEMLRSRQELAHLSRVSTLGELAGSLAHEVNQPLTAILSNAQAAQRFLHAQPIDLAEVREILADLVKDSHRASEVLRKIRCLVKKGSIEATLFSLASVVGDVALLVHSDAVMRGVRMQLDIAPNLPAVCGDRVQLQQVVLNLLLNAFEALEACAPHDRLVSIEASTEAGGHLHVVVRDRGPGLTRDQLDQLFTPYFTSKREGLGLGLSISRSIVEQHGGRIWAGNNADQGAAFHFTLPTAPEASPPA